MSMVQEFKDFALRGNVVELAVGIVIGAAFGKIVTAFVDNIIMPLVGLLAGGVDFTNLFISLDGSEHATLAAAQEAGAAVLGYGAFMQSLVDFLIVAFAIFMAIKAINSLKREEPAEEEEAPKEDPQLVLLREIRDNLQK
ncbi:MAG: large conductance mechanosensitive channel protein MscL [Pseudomonadota bacterium]